MSLREICVRSLLFVAVPLAHAACSTAVESNPASPSGASTTEGAAGSHPGGAVTGTAVDIRIDDKSETDFPQAITIAALVPVDAGGFESHAGTVKADGSFTIPGVPEGTYYLEITWPDSAHPTFLVTSERQLDLGTIQAGRADAATATQPTPLVLSVDGLSPWQDTDALEMFSLGAGMYTDFSVNVSLMAGATALTGVALDSSLFESPMLVDGSKGDKVFITQRVTTSSQGIQYAAVGNVFTPTSFTQQNGVPMTLSGTMSPVTPTMATLDWKRTAFAAAMADGNPSGSAIGDDVYIWVEPAGTQRYTSSYSPYLLTAFPDPGGPDTQFSLSYANPYPSAWGVVGQVDSCYYVDASKTAGCVAHVDLVDALVAGPVEPKLSPPRSLTIAGKSAYDALQGVGLQPTIAWQAPSLGKPSHYYLVVREILSDGTKQTAASFTTEDTSVVVPPNVLKAGSQYALRLTAESDDRTLAAPFKGGITADSADAVSGPFTP